MEQKQFQAESKRMLDLMIHSIYTHKEIFLRELISNASDAIDKLYFRSLTDDTVGKSRDDFYIELRPDKEKRTLTIIDNGIGMTAEELEQNLGVIAHSGSPGPQKAPAIKGLSSTALANTTSFAHPSPSLSAVISAVFLMISPISRTAFMLMPLRVEATLTLEHRSFVSLSTSGMEASSRSSAFVAPLCISAEYPPRKLTPTSAAARSSAKAIGFGSPWQIMLTGVTLMRLLTIGIPNSVSISSPVRTRFLAVLQILS